jgi:hypothetical protein
MKQITRVFILTQILDLTFTYYAIKSVIAFEANPLWLTVELILLKAMVIVLVAYVLEKTNLPKLVWIVPIITTLVVVWNGLVIVMEMI